MMNVECRSEDIRHAARRIDGRVLRTPLRRSDTLSRATGADVRLKLELQQPTGSYKLRGAFNAALALVERFGAHPPRLVTASAGNHGKALAHAAGELGIPLTVYVPEHAPRTKLDAIRTSGAELRPCPDYDAAERRAKEHGATGEALFISPYSYPDVIAGGGTVGLEIHEDWPEVDAIVVGIGGGGLISGIALASREITPATQIIGVEVEASSPFTHSLAAGRIVEIDVKATLADGLAGNLDPDTVTFDLVRANVDRIVTVSENELRAAISELYSSEGLTVEGAGAVGVAALLAGTLNVRDQRVAVVISGGNIDPQTLSRCLLPIEC
jgi:threonine dehydratase